VHAQDVWIDAPGVSPGYVVVADHRTLTRNHRVWRQLAVWVAGVMIQVARMVMQREQRLPDPARRPARPRLLPVARHS